MNTPNTVSEDSQDRHMQLVRLIRQISEDAGPWIGEDGCVYFTVGSLILCI